MSSWRYIMTGAQYGELHTATRSAMTAVQALINVTGDETERKKLNEAYYALGRIQDDVNTIAARQKMADDIEPTELDAAINLIRLVRGLIRGAQA